MLYEYMSLELSMACYLSCECPAKPQQMMHNRLSIPMSPFPLTFATTGETNTLFFFSNRACLSLFCRRYQTLFMILHSPHI